VAEEDTAMSTTPDHDVARKSRRLTNITPAKDDQPVITVIELTKTYQMGDIVVHALHGVSFTIGRSELVAIMGPSGSGKSTLLNVLGCLDKPTSGRYLLDGVDVSRMGDGDLAAVRNRKIGFVFQSFNLLPKLTALENVELPLLYAGAHYIRPRGIAALEAVGLGDRLHHKPKELSGGQQQRVAIARALVNDPSIILADEPTGNLDSRSSEEIMAIFQRLSRDRGITIVFVTHEPDIAQHTHRIIRVRDGRIASDELVLHPKVADPTGHLAAQAQETTKQGNEIRATPPQATMAIAPDVDEVIAP
jgi:putative ABC transport system ATP-binding protein